MVQSDDPLVKAATVGDLMAATGNLEAAARQHEQAGPCLTPPTPFPQFFFY